MMPVQEVVQGLLTLDIMVLVAVPVRVQAVKSSLIAAFKPVAKSTAWINARPSVNKNLSNA